MRIAHFLASAGIASRRKAEQLILANKIKINNEVVNILSTIVKNTDIVTYNSCQVIIKKAKLWLYYKPNGIVVSHQDELRRTTIFDDLCERLNLNHVISVGRLDLNSEGLMLITNSGFVAKHFENPSNQYKRVYHVRSYGLCNFNLMQKKLETGIYIDRISYQAVKIKQLSDKITANNWFEVTLHEGKNREIRKIFAYFGLEVNRLIRVQYGKYYLNNMKKNDIIEIINFDSSLLNNL